MSFIELAPDITVENCDVELQKAVTFEQNWGY